MTTAVAGEQPLEASWTDPKRYLWLLGLVVPTVPFIAYGLVELTGLEIMWWAGPFVVFVLIPFLDAVIGKDSANPPDSRDQVARAGPLLPLVHLRVHPASSSRRSSSAARSGRAATSPSSPSSGSRSSMAMVSGIAINTAHELGHKTQEVREVARQDRALDQRLRPLLHRAQPRPPRAGRDARGPGLVAARRELLGVPSAHRVGQPDVGAPPGEGAARPARQAVLLDPQRHPERLGDDRRPVRRR